MQTQFKNIDSVLGANENRYFSSGYKAFHFDLVDLVQHGPDKLSGTLDFHYNGKARPRNEAVHLGSIEYMAITLRLASYALSKLLGLSNEQIDMCTLESFSTEIRHPIYLGKVSFILELDSISRDRPNTQGRHSCFILHLDRTIIRFCLDHQCRRYHHLPESIMLNPYADQLYNSGYKQRSVHIHNIDIVLSEESISATGTFDNLLDENTVHGLGSARDVLLPTDTLQVFGQLMQAILYQKLGADREQCPNIWLRKMKILVDRPIFKKDFQAKVWFEHTRQLVQKKKQWQIIELSGQVGHYRGVFQVAHELPSSRVTL